jgi:hypothetical protein
MKDRFLEKIGIFKHQVTAEEVDKAYLKEKELTAEYLTEKISLKKYEEELDKLPKLDLIKLAHDLHYRG